MMGGFSSSPSATSGTSPKAHAHRAWDSKVVRREERFGRRRKSCGVLRMNNLPSPRRGILDISPYVGGESRIEGASRIMRLASNEGALGPSRQAVTAYKSVAEDIYRYPDGSSTALRNALAAQNHIDTDRIVCGAGSDELINLLCQCYVAPDDEVLYSQYGYLMYFIYATAAGSTPVAAPEQNFKADVSALLGRVSPKTRILFIANPNNPTGSYLTKLELEALHLGLPSSVLLVIDAAYAEFVTATDYSSGFDLARRSENVVVLRTFSKIYALAGLRVAWAYCSNQVADVLNRVRGPFNVSLPAQAATIAALADVDFVDRARRHNSVWRPWLERELFELGLTVLPSVANFVTVRVGSGSLDADATFAFLRSRGILTRKIGAYLMPEWLRIAVGTEEEVRAVTAAIKEFLLGDTL